MATTTTNFGWDIPQSTDLVKDGATAIAALGQDIDTAFVDFKGGTTGQVLKKTSGTDLDVEWGTPSSGLTLINTTSFSAVASVAFPQDTFTSTFDHYLILGNYTSSSAALTNLTGRLMAAGSALTNANYDSTNANQDTNNTVSYQSQTGQTSWNVMQRLRDVPHRFEMILYGPKLVGTTPYNFRGIGINAGNSALGVTTGGGNFSLTTSADSIQYLGATGTITGTISCYGFND
jgi:hypothetical protein